MHTFTSTPSIVFSRAERLGKHIGLVDDTLAAFLGISPKTLSRRRTAGKLDVAESLRLEMLEKIYALAQDILGSEERAKTWLTQPLVGLDNRAPPRATHQHPGL